MWRCKSLVTRSQSSSALPLYAACLSRSTTWQSSESWCTRAELHCHPLLSSASSRSSYQMTTQTQEKSSLNSGPALKKKTPAAHPPSNTHRRSTSSLPWSQSWSHNPWDPPLSALHHDWPSVYGAKYSVLVAGYIHASMISIHVYAFCVGEPLPKYNVVGSHLPKYYYIREPPHMGWL